MLAIMSQAQCASRNRDTHAFTSLVNISLIAGDIRKWQVCILLKWTLPKRASELQPCLCAFRDRCRCHGIILCARFM